MKAILLLAALTMIPTAQAKERDFSVYKLHGPVNRQMAQDFNFVASKAKELEVFRINIDSPGGSVFSGLSIIRRIHWLKRQHVQVDCVVTGIAASMAFAILAECDNRMAFPMTQLLWHPMTIGGNMRLKTADVYNIWVNMKALETLFTKRICDKLGIEKEVFQKHWVAETFHFAEDLARLAPGFLTVLD